MMDEIREILIALDGKYTIGQHVSTDATKAKDCDIVINRVGDHFTHGMTAGVWHGNIRDIDGRRSDFLLIGHMLGTDPDVFVAWYKPDDVGEWHWNG